MNILSDTHIHSAFSGDSTEPMENIIKEGIQKGLSHLCFTEHMDMDFPISDVSPEGMFLLNTDSYLYDLLRLKNQYAGQIKILFGVELGLQPHLKREIAVYSKSFDFDFIIGSTHVANKKDPYLPSFYEGRSEEEAFREYFEAVYTNVTSFSNYDVCGHLDYCVRYGKEMDKNYSYDKYKDILDRILNALIEREKGLEINTGSLRYGTRECSPCSDILKRYRELGGEIVTIGSDAHKAKDLAADVNTAGEVLSSCGFKYYCIFEKRMPEFIKL